MIHEWSPWTHLAKPARQCRLALITTAGVWLDGWQQPFVAGDPSFRELPVNVLLTPEDGFRMAFADMANPNAGFPLEVLRDLEGRGILGPLATLHYSFGQTEDWLAVTAEYAPSVAYRLRRAQVEVALVVATRGQERLGGLVARSSELAGVATIVIGAEAQPLYDVRPPRSLVVPGGPLGPERLRQEQVILEALDAIDQMDDAGAVFTMA